MAAPSSIAELLDLAQKSGILDINRLTAYVQQLNSQNALPAEPNKLAGLMVRDSLLTLFQAENLLLGKWKRFTIGKYRVLERLGSGGMGQVFLCEHKMMQRRVAVKVLPTAKADDPSSKERFYREARVIGAIDHPNIVRAHDIDQDDNLHFLVMEFVDGPNLQEIVKRTGPMDPVRACHYAYQSAIGLQHAFDSAGIIHRDIKPGNILVDRTGVVKILDMGLARFFHDEQDLLTRKFDETVLGTADYLAPEQAIDSHTVDIRADIYSLGATFYFMLTGQAPFTEGTVAQKLIWHQTRDPKPIRSIRPEIPDAIVAIIQKMMMKDPAKRYQKPIEVAEALTPFVATPIPPPSEAEMPPLSPAARGASGNYSPMPASKVVGPISPAPKKAAAKTDVELPPSAPTTISSSPPAPVPPQRPAPAPASKPAMKLPASSVPPGSSRAPAPAARSTPAAIKQPAQATVETLDNSPSPLWAKITTDTPKPKSASHTDTDRNSPIYKPPSATYESFRGTAKANAKPSNTKLILLVGAGVLLGILIIGVLLALGLFGSKNNKKAENQQQPAVHTLVVDAAAKADNATTFARVSYAAKRAKSGDVIKVRSPVQEQWSEFKVSALANDVTIEAEAPPGQYVSWRLPANSMDTKAVLYLKDCRGWKFKGFEFDGQGKAEDAIYLVAHCPGLTFENCRAVNCTDSAIKLNNVSGDPDHPVSFNHFRATGIATGKSAVTLFASLNIQSNRANQHIAFRDGIIDGPCNALVTVDGSATDVAFQHVRFFQAADGLVIKPIRANQSCKLVVESSSFARISKSAVLVQASPAKDASPETGLTINGNLFATCGNVFTIADNKPAAYLSSRDNVRDPASGEGNGKLETRVANVKWLSEDPGDERRFLRYASDSPLNAKPFGPVGVPPVD